MTALIIEDETAAALNLKAILRETAPEIEVLDTLDGGTMIPLVRAVSRMENGVAADAAAVLRGWELFAEDYGGSRTAAETPSAHVRSPGGVPAHAARKASRRGGPQCRAGPGGTPRARTPRGAGYHAK